MRPQACGLLSRVRTLHLVVRDVARHRCVVLPLAHKLLDQLLGGVGLAAHLGQAAAGGCGCSRSQPPSLLSHAAVLLLPHLKLLGASRLGLYRRLQCPHQLVHGALVRCTAQQACALHEASTAAGAGAGISQARSACERTFGQLGRRWRLPWQQQLQALRHVCIGAAWLQRGRQQHHRMQELPPAGAAAGFPHGVRCCRPACCPPAAAAALACCPRQCLQLHCAWDHAAREIEKRWLRVRVACKVAAAKGKGNAALRRDNNSGAAPMSAAGWWDGAHGGGGPAAAALSSAPAGAGDASAAVLPVPGATPHGSAAPALPRFLAFLAESVFWHALRLAPPGHQVLSVQEAVQLAAGTSTRHACASGAMDSRQSARRHHASCPLLTSAVSGTWQVALRPNQW